MTTSRARILLSVWNLVCSRLQSVILYHQIFAQCLNGDAVLFLCTLANYKFNFRYLMSLKVNRKNFRVQEDAFLVCAESYRAKPTAGVDVALPL